MKSNMKLSTTNFIKSRYKNNLIYYDENNYMEYVALRIINNLRTYLYTGEYETKVFSFVSEFKDKESLINYIDDLSYFDRLLFYSNSLVELSIYENNLLENNKEIKNPLKSYELIKYVLGNSNDKNCINNFIDRNELKSVMLKVCGGYKSKNRYLEVEKLTPTINDIPKIYNKYVEDKKSIYDYYSDLVNIKNNSITENMLNKSINELNSKKNVGLLKDFKVEVNEFDSTINEFDKILGETEIENFVKLQNDINKTLYKTKYEYEFINDKEIVNNLQTHLEDINEREMED